MDVKLAEALLRRKELQGKVDVLKQIKDKDLFEVRGKRQKISDDLDDVIAQVPLESARETMADLQAHRDMLAAMLIRLRDALEPAYSMSPEGRTELARIQKALDFAA